MPATKSDLDLELEHLRLDVANVNVLRNLTRAQERRVMGDVFVWWQRAREVNGYLEQCYAANDIAFNKTQGEVNFRPLLRLVTQNQLTNNDLETWAKVLPKVLEDVVKSPKHYAANPAEKIAHFVEQKGGKRALAGYYTSKTAINEPTADAEIEPELFFTLDEAEFLPTLLSASQKRYATSTPLAATIPTAKTTADGYSILLVRQSANGTQLIGSVDNQRLVDDLMTNTYRNDFEAMPVTMRSVLEIIHILNVPKAIASSADKFIEYSNLKDAWNVGKKELAVKRLIYRPATGDFLLSCQQVPAAVVVHAKPHANLMQRDDGDTFLSNSTRKSIETRLLHQSMFNLFEPSEAEQYRVTSVPGISAHSIRLNTKLEIADSAHVKAHTIVQHTENLNHSPISFIPFYAMFGEPRWQVDCKPADFTPAWAATLDLNWLRLACNDFFDQWIAQYGVKAKRAINNVLKFQARASELVLGFEYEKTLGFDNSKTLTLPSEKAAGSVELHVRSADFAFVLRQIADLNVMGALDIKADEHAIMLNFSTSANSYQCWIPACDLSGSRSTKHFTIYTPTHSPNLLQSEDPDDLASEMTDKEHEALPAMVKRKVQRERT